ncbi:metalloendoproteinase 4-MMP-like [Hibiscus syriacus]|uniref:metalloendoproteinase 4-MMP-like n=1 Tax=Hibiscus syriacus TaxID=106335 RepID=UPI0019243940|nr:metalloendoproteinase 4-MMP-like [Hibiscus syriacus]
MAGKIPHALLGVFLLLLVLQPFVVKSGTVKLESPPDWWGSRGGPDDVGRPNSDLEAANQTLSRKRWYRFPVTYGFYSGIEMPSGVEPQDVARAFDDAFAKWKAAVPKLNFKREQPGDNSDIKIGFTAIKSPKFGVGYYPPKGMLLLDNSHTHWSTASNPARGEIDLQSTALHEIGHTIGLKHSNDPASVMYPTLSFGTIKRELTQLDINNLRALYSPSTP